MCANLCAFFVSRQAWQRFDVVVQIGPVVELGLPVKVIHEVGRLNPAALELLVEASIDAGAAYLKTGSGFGRALGTLINQCKCRHRKGSVFAEAARLQVPLTVHVAIGTDTAHAHPEVDCGVLGAASERDFEIITQVVSKLNRGVWINVGSAVVLPEVFMKAYTVAANLGASLEGMTTANLDQIQHYRPTQNVLRRPTDRGVALTGHHEIMVPLLRHLVLKALETE